MAANQINRRKALIVVAAAPAAVALPAFASVGEDAELRELWDRYLAQLAAYDRAHTALMERRDPYETEYDALKVGVIEEGDGNLGRLHETLWQKHGLEPFSAAWNREGRNLRRIVKAIRKAKAESLFGIGVKLSVVEDPSVVHEDDLADSIYDALRAIEGLTGIDFVADGGLVESFV